MIRSDTKTPRSMQGVNRAIVSTLMLKHLNILMYLCICSMVLINSTCRIDVQVNFVPVDTIAGGYGSLFELTGPSRDRSNLLNHKFVKYILLVILNVFVFHFHSHHFHSISINSFSQLKYPLF